jgi:hypothetical protein
MTTIYLLQEGHRSFKRGFAPKTESFWFTGERRASEVFPFPHLTDWLRARNCSDLVIEEEFFDERTLAIDDLTTTAEVEIMLTFF